MIGLSIALGGCAALIDLRDDYQLGEADAGSPIEGGPTQPGCANGVLDEPESDIDCGGTCPKCAPGRTCAIAADCASGVCSGQPKTCQAPRCDDGVRNGDETDVDCAGACPGCALGAACEAGTDCIASGPDAGDAGSLTECVKKQCTPVFPSATWTNRTPGGTPFSSPQRFNTPVVYDPARRRTMFYGGEVVANRLNDTWQWDGTQWTQYTATNVGNRGRHTMTFDRARGVVVMAGGYDVGGNLNPSTSTFNGAWQNAGAFIPGGSLFMGSAYDSVRQRVVAYGGVNAAGPRAGLWQWNGAAWSPATEGTMTPGPRAWVAIAFDEARGQLVFFGGADSEGGGNPFGDTWLWDGANWTKQTPSRGPDARYGHAMTYDAQRERVVLVGGYGAGAPAARNDVWEWNGKIWIRSTDYPVTPPSTTGWVAYDSDRKLAVAVDVSAARTYEYTVVGNACTTGADCASGFCVDRVCCRTAACGTCEACNQLANPGTCTAVRDAPDPDSCMPPKRCNAAGMCP